MNGLIWEGCLYGLMLAIMIGPIFVALVHTGIETGFRAGVAVAFGIWISDMIIITSCIMLMTNSMSVDCINSDTKHWAGIVGGIIMMLFGLGSILKKKVPDLDAKVFEAKDFFHLFIKGIIVNTANPFTFFFWIGLVSANYDSRNFSIEQGCYFFGSIMLTIIITDLLKVYMAKKIRSKLTVHNLSLISKLVGVVLIFFGVVLIWRTW